MEPLSITVSITALLHVTKSIISYLRALRDAPDDQVKLTSEVSHLDILLTLLQSRVKKAKPEDPWFAAVLALGDGPLDQLKSDLDQLALKLEPAKGLKGVKNRVTWVLNKREVMEILSKIERTKTLVTLVLTDDLL